MTATPIWLLDVDGVLNAVCEGVPSGYRRSRVDGFGIVYDPKIVERITALHTSGAVEVRWLTTWCERAAEFLAPDLGLPPFKVEGATDCWGGTGRYWWKSIAAERVSDHEPNRPLIWTDDDLAAAENQHEVDWLTHRLAPAFTLSPDWRTGITDEQMTAIEAFIAAPEPPGVTP